MQDYKIEYFLRDFPNGHFPNFSRLTQDNVLQLEQSLGRKMNLSRDKNLWNNLLSLSDGTIFDPESQTFNLHDLLFQEKLPHSSEVVIVWDTDESGSDRIQLDDLDKYFGSIWYPGQDMGIVSSNLDWIIFVLHYGVRVLRVPPD